MFDKAVRLTVRFNVVLVDDFGSKSTITCLLCLLHDNKLEHKVISVNDRPLHTLSKKHMNKLNKMVSTDYAQEEIELCIDRLFRKS